MANDFLNFYRSAFMGQRDQVNAEKKAEKAEAKAAKATAEAEKAKEEANTYADLKEAKAKVNSFLTNLRNALETAAKEATNKMIEQAPQSFEKAEEIEPLQDLSQPGATAYDANTQTYYYTYKPGDTFGQVIKDLGLESGNGLWGENGDVAYYTKQLNDQGITGNIPIGTTIKLKHRNTPAQTINAGRIVQEGKYPALQQVIREGSRKV